MTPLHLATAALALLWISPTQAHAQFTHRLTTILYDYDNNGMTDAMRTYTYVGARATAVSYVYQGDGTPDLFVTEDDDAQQEAGIIGYSADDLVDLLSLDRDLMGGGSEEFSTALTFVAGELTRIDSDSMAGGMTNATFMTFFYDAADRLERIEERMDSDSTLVFEQSYVYGPDDLPSEVSFDSSGVDAVTTMNWRPDGQIDDLSSTATFGMTPVGTGAADFVYDADGFLQTETWTRTGSVGSFFAEFQGIDYKKTHGYDPQDLKVLEEIDVDDDGTVEATRTFVWEAGPCVPAFTFASNGRPNFTRMPGLPYVPGTGAQWFENCGPVSVAPAPVPMLPPPLGLGLGALLGLLLLGMRRARA